MISQSVARRSIHKYMNQNNMRQIKKPVFTGLYKGTVTQSRAIRTRIGSHLGSQPVYFPCAGSSG
jgi:hypothetical protein